MRQAITLASTVFLLSGSFIAYGQEWPREAIPAPRILDEVKAHRSGLAVWWTGHNGWLIKSDGLLVGTDLATEDEARLYRSPITAEELAPLLDIAFITHRHGDHFNRRTARILAERGQCTFVMPANCVEDARRLGIPASRIKVASPRQPFELKGVKVSPLRDPRQPQVRRLLRREPGGLRLSDRARGPDVPPAGRLGTAGGPPVPQARRRVVLLADRAQHAHRSLGHPDQRAGPGLHPAPAPRHVSRDAREPLLDQWLLARGQVAAVEAATGAVSYPEAGSETGDRRAIRWRGTQEGWRSPRRTRIVPIPVDTRGRGHLAHLPP